MSPPFISKDAFPVVMLISWGLMLMPVPGENLAMPAWKILSAKHALPRIFAGIALPCSEPVVPGSGL